MKTFWSVWWCCAAPMQLWPHKCQIIKCTTSLFSSTQLRTHIQYSLALIGNRGDKNCGSINSPVSLPSSLPSFLPPIFFISIVLGTSCGWKCRTHTLHLLACPKFHNTCCWQFSGSSRMVYENTLHCLRALRNHVISSVPCGERGTIPSFPSHPFLVQKADPTHPPQFCYSNCRTLLCFLENLDTEETLEVETCTEPSSPRINHVM